MKNKEEISYYLPLSFLFAIKYSGEKQAFLWKEKPFYKFFSDKKDIKFVLKLCGNAPYGIK